VHNIGSYEIKLVQYVTLQNICELFLLNYNNYLIKKTFKKGVLIISIKVDDGKCSMIKVNCPLLSF
jgi:hypothetical protein